MIDQPLSKKRESKTSASAAGAGGGTLLVIIANSLPDENIWKSILLYAAPSVSILMSAIWLWIQSEIINYMRDRKINSLAQKTKTILEDSLNNKNTSNKHRDNIRNKLEELELIVAEREIKRIKSLSPITGKELGNIEKDQQIKNQITSR